MTTTKQPPTLADPGFGRHWEWELLKHKYGPRGGAWHAGLVSRTGNTLGYIGWYEGYGWSATLMTRTKCGSKILPGAWTTAEAAAESLLRALRDKR